MGLEYRIFYLKPGQQSPHGSLGIGTSDNGLLWGGQQNTLSKDYESKLISVLEVAKIYGGIIKKTTFEYIESCIPQWKLNRYRRYYDLRQKVLSFVPLNDGESLDYESFPDPKEKHEDCDKYVFLVLKWYNDCIKEHNRVYFGMLEAKTIEEILSIKNSLSYPKFVF